MKQFIITALVVLTTCLSGLAESKIYNACRMNKILKTVYVSKEMLNLVEESSLKVNKMDFTKLISKTNSIEIISADTKNGVRALEGAFNAYILTPYLSRNMKLSNPHINFKPNPGDDYKLILDITEDGIETVIFSRDLGKGIQEYILKLNDTVIDEMYVVVIVGTMSAGEIKAIKNKKGKK